MNWRCRQNYKTGCKAYAKTLRSTGAVLELSQHHSHPADEEGARVRALEGRLIAEGIERRSRNRCIVSTIYGESVKQDLSEVASGTR